MRTEIFTAKTVTVTTLTHKKENVVPDVIYTILEYQVIWIRNDRDIVCVMFVQVKFHNTDRVRTEIFTAKTVTVTTLTHKKENVVSNVTYNISKY